MSAARCHACGRVADGDASDVRAVCGGCGAWLHCCRNCEFHAPGHADACREPQAERVADETAGNFCEWFRPASVEMPVRATKADDARARLDKLFVKKVPPAR